MIKESGVNYKLLIPFLLSVTGHILLAYFFKRTEIYHTFFIYFFLFVCYLFICKQNFTEKEFRLLIIGAVLIRCLWLPAFPQLSDDYARFVWDGRLLAHGYNPFFYLPSQIMKTGFPATSVDPQLYNMLNSQEYYTCYPPLLQLIFGIAAWLFPHNLIANIITLRLFIFFAEIGSIFLLVKLLAILNKPRKNVLLYALNPLVIAELTGNFHYEALVIFFILLMLFCIYKKRFWVFIVTLTLAVISKLLPLIFLPILLFYFGWRKGLIFCFGVGILFVFSWLPFIDMAVINKFWSSINSFFVESEFNASIYYVVRFVVDYFKHENMIQINGPVLSIISAVLIFTYAFLKRNKLSFNNLPQHFIWTLLLFLAFTTTVHPWYIIPMIAFCSLTHYRFPVVWSGVIFLSYYTYHAQSFEESTTLLFIEYGAAIAAILFELGVGRKKLLKFWNLIISKMKNIYLFIIICTCCIYNCEGQITVKSKTISQHRFKKLMNKENAEILDVRTPEEYNSWHMENAINIDFKNENFLQQILQLDKNKTYLLYCHSGRRSGKALLLMHDSGFTKVYHLKNGILDWEGNPQKE